MGETSRWLSTVGRRLLNRNKHLRLDHDPRLRELYERCTGLDPKRIESQPISEARFVVIDTETTGFGAYAGDEVVSICMLELQGLEYTGQNFNSLVNPGRTIPDSSTRIHGLSDSDVAEAPDIENLIPDICEFIGEGVVVGHHVNFDLRFLNKTLYRLLGCKFRNPWVDTMLLFLSSSGRMGHYTLEEVARVSGVNIKDRHTAQGDALAALEIFAVLAAQLVGPNQPVSKLVKQQSQFGYL